MFSNIGSKLKMVAQVTCWIGIIGSIIAGVVMMAADMVLAGLLSMIGGSLLSWVGSLATYAFGELVENTSDIVAAVYDEDEIYTD